MTITAILAAALLQAAAAAPVETDRYLDRHASWNLLTTENCDGTGAIEDWRVLFRKAQLWGEPFRWATMLCGRHPRYPVPDCFTVASGELSEPAAVRMEAPATLTVYARRTGPDRKVNLLRSDGTPITVRTRDYADLPQAERNGSAPADDNFVRFDEKNCARLPPPIVSVPAR